MDEKIEWEELMALLSSLPLIDEDEDLEDPDPFF